MGKQTQANAALDFVLINEFDSVEQKRIFDLLRADGSTQAAIEQHFVGLLRMGMILCKEVVITDAMLFDGFFFQAIGPRDLETRLGLNGQPLGIQVLSKHASLRDALNEKLEDPLFVWQINSHSSDESFPSQRVVERWDEWLRADERGAISTRTYAERPKNSFRDSLFSLLAESKNFVASATNISPEVVERVCTLTPKRSEAFTFLESLDLTPENLNNAQAWWNRSYLETIAREQGAAWMSFEVSDQSAGAKTFLIWESLLHRVSLASPAVYSTLLYALSHERMKWNEALTSVNVDSRHRRGNRALKGIAYVTANHMLGARRSAVGIRATLTIVLGVLGFLLARSGAEQRPELSWLVVLVALAALPWHEVKTLSDAVRTQKRGVLKIA